MRRRSQDLRWRPGHLNNRRRQSAEMAALWPVGVQRPAPRHMRKSTSPENDTLNGPGRPRRITPRLPRGPSSSVRARHGPWATKRRARPRNGCATSRTGRHEATPIPTRRTARGKECVMVGANKSRFKPTVNVILERYSRQGGHVFLSI